MTKALEVPQERASRRKLARMEAQEGPWSVSVADTPYDKNSYSIYIKSEYSTSHLTLHPQSFQIKLFSRRWICFTSISLCFAIREAVSLLTIRFVHKFVHRCASFAHLHLLLFPCSPPGGDGFGWFRHVRDRLWISIYRRPSVLCESRHHYCFLFYRIPLAWRECALLTSLLHLWHNSY